MTMSPSRVQCRPGVNLSNYIYIVTSEGNNFYCRMAMPVLRVQCRPVTPNLWSE